ncbi:hypothetical protein [Streptomyces canus]|uniref:hypothetical protein n=1 Tax=Streptomyces canus TaxID=58343 RepID=UPI0036ECC57C
MGYKAIAAAHPVYGQQAVRSSLGRITLAGPRAGGGLPGADEVIDVTDRVDALRRAAGLR